MWRGRKSGSRCFLTFACGLWFLLLFFFFCVFSGFLWHKLSRIFAQVNLSLSRPLRGFTFHPQLTNLSDVVQGWCQAQTRASDVFLVTCAFKYWFYWGRNSHFGLTTQPDQFKCLMLIITWFDGGLFNLLDHFWAIDQGKVMTEVG